MTKKANSEIAGEFVAYLHGQKLEVFKETHVIIGGTTRHEFLHIGPRGQQEHSMSFHELCQQLRQWVQAMGIAKSQAQVDNIAKIVWSKIEERAAA